MTTKVRISIGATLALAMFIALLATNDAETSPIIKYASVIVRPGNPTLAGGYQAQPGTLYGRSDSAEAWLKSGLPATSWLQLVTSGNGMFPSFGSTLVNGDLTVTGNTTLGDNAAADSTTIKGTLFTQQGAGAAGIVIGDAVNKDWTFYLTGTSIALHEYTTTFLGGGGADRITFAAGGTITVPGVVNDNGWTTLVQAAAQDVTNAQDTDSNTFTFAVTAGNTYALECTLLLGGSNNANDAEFRIAVSAGTMTGRGNAIGVSAADATVTTLVSANAAANTAQIPVGTFTGAGSPTSVILAYSWVQNTTSGTAKIQFGNLVIGGGIVSRMIKGSQCRWKLVV